ncbi:hypothetical protein HZC09_01890 [Candidatus Micrarchaeota archaeon]|nr:hypothetical protein [Candidatus Micrarchaeota archaeon]
MDEKTLKKMFRPGFSTKGTGRGLGLASVMKIITDHGGTIFARSKKGVGTEFTVELPLHKR